MTDKRILVTGASGFIGRQLVNRLVERGNRVTCFVRPASEVASLTHNQCRFIYGDLADSANSLLAGEEFDVVYHLAARTRAIRARDLIRTNTMITGNLLRSFADAASPPVVVMVSSLSAAGPSAGSQPRVETDPPNPVSDYGRSKAASELEAVRFSGRIPISIARPPIVLGEGDRNGLKMFRMIDKFGWHVVPGFRDRVFSVIHVADLVTALIGIAEKGNRLGSDIPSRGIYFVSDDRAFTFAEIGRMIGRALGRKHTRIYRVGKPGMWAVSIINELLGRILSRPQYLNHDKYREAFAGSWCCSSEKLKRETDFAIPVSFEQRLEQTVRWYRKNGWLNSHQHAVVSSSDRVGDAT